MDISQMNQAMGSPSPAPKPASGTMTVDQMQQIMNGGSLQPNQSATVLGHSNGILMGLINGAESLLPAAGAIAGGVAGGTLGLAGGPVGAFAGAVAGSGLGGAAGQIAESGLQGKVATPKEVGTQAAIMAGTEALAGPLGNIGGKLLKAGGEAVSKMVIPTSAQEAVKLQAYKAANPLWERITSVFTGKEVKEPSTAASTVFQKALMGTEAGIGIRARRAASTVWKKTVEPALDSSTAKQDMPSFFNEVEQSIVKNTSELGDRNARTEALNAIKEDYAKNPTATMKELQSFKEGWASHVPQKYYKGQDITATYNNVRAELADLAREKLYKNLGPEAKQAYLDYGNLKAVQELGKQAMVGKKTFSGSVWNAVKDYAVVPAGTIGGQVIYKVGQGVELFGPAGAKTVADLIDQSDTQSPQGE